MRIRWWNKAIYNVSWICRKRTAETLNCCNYSYFVQFSSVESCFYSVFYYHILCGEKIILCIPCLSGSTASVVAAVAVKERRVSLRAHLDSAVGSWLFGRLYRGYRSSSVDRQNSRHGAGRIAEIDLSVVVVVFCCFTSSLRWSTLLAQWAPNRLAYQTKNVLGSIWHY